MIRVLWAAGLLPVVVGALMVGLGYRVLGDPGAMAAGAAGLAVLGAVAAGLHGRLRLRSPAVIVAVGLVAAVVVEIVVPGPTVVALGGDRLTLGVPVLARFATGWPLLLALAVLAGMVELRWQQAVRPGWAATLRTAAVTGLVLTGLVLLAGVGRGWLTAPPPWLAWTLPMLAGSGFLAALPLIRARLLTPALVFGAAIGLATVVSWVQPVGDPVTGLLTYSTWYCALALLIAGGELVGRAGLRGLRRRAARNPTSAAAAGPATSPSRS